MFAEGPVKIAGHIVYEHLFVTVNVRASARCRIVAKKLEEIKRLHR